MKVLFLYTELADYFLACIRQLVQNHPVEVHIVRWPVKEEAPFSFQFPENTYVYERKEHDRHSLISLVDKLQPAVIVSSGWMDREYVAVCQKFKGNIPVVGSMDNHWQGNLKQQIARIISPFTICRYFDFLWVPGEPQEYYAKKLGFRPSQIIKGYYSADVPKFEKIYQEKILSEEYPRRFLYVGRYLPHKGIFDMWQAFIELSEEYADWELWCLGTGEEWENKVLHPNIRHIGFVQPQNISDYLLKTCVFILPSHFEPWGVVVHEMAAAGFPMLCSNLVGAASKFLEEVNNGYSFEAANKDSLKSAMQKMMQSSPEELKRMGEHSNRLSKAINPELWSKSLLAAIR